MSLRISKRYISITKPPTTTVPPSIDFKSTADPLPQIGKQLSVDILGQPPTLASCSIPPSVPLYIRKGSLISLYTKSSKNPLDCVTLSNEYQSPFKATLYGLPGSFQKVISTAEIQALVSSNVTPVVSWSNPFTWVSLLKQTAQFKSFVQLSMDGTSDWAVFGNSLYGYSKDVGVDSVLLPRGLRTFGPWGYQLLRGRGAVLLSGQGSVYKLDLAAGEEILVKGQHLVGLACNGKDLSRVKAFKLNGDEKSVPVQKTEEVQQFKEYQFTEFFVKIGEWSLALAKKIQHKWVEFISGSDGYVKIQGPGAVLLQSSSKISVPVSPYEPTQLPRASKKKQVASNLSIVTIKNGKAEFESVANFDETVEYIKSLKNKK